MACYTIITAGWRKRFTTSHFICKCTVHALFPSDCRGLRDRSIVLYYHIRNRSYRQSGYHNHRTGKSGNRKFSGYCPLCVGKLSGSGSRICHIHTILFEKEFDPVRWRTADFGVVIPSAVLFVILIGLICLKFPVLVVFLGFCQLSLLVVGADSESSVCIFQRVAFYASVGTNAACLPVNVRFGFGFVFTSKMQCPCGSYSLFVCISLLICPFFR